MHSICLLWKTFLWTVLFCFQVNHIYICDYHKNMIQSARMKRKRRDSDDGDGSPDGDEDYPEVCRFMVSCWPWTDNWAASWWNQQNDCAPSEDRSARASAQSDQSLLCAQWVAKDPSFLHADSEDSDQTGWMPRLIWVFAGRTCHLLVLWCCGSVEKIVAITQTFEQGCFTIE